MAHRHGIDPRDVPCNSELVTVSGPDGSRTIRYTAYVRAGDGLISASQQGHPRITQREVPLVMAETLPDWIAAHTA
ncbi:hypothetical protein [Streptomyces sp. NPDC001415]